MAAHAMFDDDKQRVRDAADIVRVIGDHIALKPKGREYACLCPFHDDHSPSMFVSPEKQIFKCFSCGAGGDVFSFVQRFHAMSFPEALNHLAEQFGVTLSRAPRRDDTPSTGSPAQVRDACAAARDFYRAILKHPQHGALARDAIARRGISPEMAELFQLGAAPDRWDGLLATLVSKGLPLSSFIAAGLVRPRPSGEGHFDFLRNRLVFPILDQVGRPIAFGGRKLRDEDEPKYLNTPESAAFNKSDTLFGYHQARAAIQKTGTALVVEGYTDVIACHQHGFANAVAALGTAFTASHARRLSNLATRIILLFDNDDAGQRAADRAAEIFLRTGVEALVAVAPDDAPAKDPDELFRLPGGVDAFRRMLENASSILRYRYDRLAARLEDAGVTERATALEQEVRRLGELGFVELKPAHRHFIVRELATITGMSQGQLRALLPAGRSPAHAAPAPGSPQRPGPREHLLGCVLVEPTLLFGLDASHRPLLEPDAYPSASMGTVAQCVLELASSGLHPGLGEVLTRLDDEHAKADAVQLADHIERITESRPERLARLFQDTLRALEPVDTPLPTPSTGADALESIQQRIDQRRARGDDRRIRPRTDA